MKIEIERSALVRCCGAAAWVDGMVEKMPFRDHAAVMEAAAALWWSLDETDWREAFEHHPKIGDVDSLREKYADTKAWAAGEQSGVNDADEAILQALSDGNEAYEAKFGYIFIVCATGKSAAEMLTILQARSPNDPAVEIRVAAAEQLKITQIRLGKWLDES